MKSIITPLSVLLFTLAFASEAHAEICAYAVVNIDGEVMAHPVVIVALDEGSVAIDPVIVHVDATEQSVLGYSIATPEISYQTDPVSIFVPGVDKTIEHEVHVLQELEREVFHCVHAGTTTPAIPIYIPASSLQIPGTQTHVPAITVNWLGQTISYPGTVITTEDHEIYVPSAGITVEPVTISIPDHTIAIPVEQSIEIIPVLEPLVVDDPDSLPIPLP